MKQTGRFVISLDLELYWGMIDKVTLAEYGNHIKGVRAAIPAMLNAFEKHGIHATWATVGMLMHGNKETLVTALPDPELRPTYADPRASSYEHIATETIGVNELEDPYHFGASLVRMIIERSGQEIGSHTFSHYYCIDGVKNGSAIFDADCTAFDATAKQFGLTATSIVFPRNQADDEALRVCAQHGITAYRGTEEHFIYRARAEAKQTNPLIRAVRLLDHYVNLSGKHTYTLAGVKTGTLANVRASRFLRPYSKRLHSFEPLRLRRIKRAMTRAAKRGEVFHLWWHPHNFGANLRENMQNLETILAHYDALKEQYGMESMNMQEVAAVASTI